MHFRFFDCNKWSLKKFHTHYSFLIVPVIFLLYWILLRLYFQKTFEGFLLLKYRNFVLNKFSKFCCANVILTQICKLFIIERNLGIYFVTFILFNFWMDFLLIKFGYLRQLALYCTKFESFWVSGLAIWEKSNYMY